MSRKYTTYTHPLAPGLLLTVEAQEALYRDGGQTFQEDFRLEAAKLNAFGTVVDLLKGCPRHRDPLEWVTEAHPDRAALVDLCLDKGKVTEEPVAEEPTKWRLTWEEEARARRTA